MGLGRQEECEAGVFFSLVLLLSDPYGLAAFLYPVTLQKLPVTARSLCLSGLEVLVLLAPEDSTDLC